MSHVFISHIRNNRRLVQRLCDDLTKHGVNVWLDRKDIDPGAYWKQAIRRAIQNGAFFIACFSGQYNQRTKTYMNEELALAIDELRQRLSNDQAWFIPVLISKCEVPDIEIVSNKTLKDLNYVELHKGWNAGIQRILDVIQPLTAEVQILIKALDSDDYYVRTSAIEALGKTGQNRVVPALVQALRDKEPDVPIYAVEALEKIGDPTAIYALIEALNDKDLDTLRIGIAHTLVNIANPSAVPALVQALGDEWSDIQIPAADALVKIGEPAVPALIESLSDENYEVRSYTAIALKRIGTPEALKAVEDYEKSKR